MSTFTVGQRLGPYEVAASIGAGGMGKVYRALDTRLNRTVAIKVSREQFTERFEREARAVAALNHPNICTLYDVGPNYLVMELIEGETLKGPLPLETALHYARQIAAALEAAHHKGIVHRDLKPGNIRIKPDGSVKVLDFGLAKIFDSASGHQNPETSPTLTDGTLAGVILGTAAYMSPEQARGEAVDQRADIWAFGVVLYEMLAGRKLFEAQTVSDTVAAVLTKEPDLDRVPPQLRLLLRCCLAKEPQHRLHHIADVRLLLDKTAEPAPPPVAASPSRIGIVGWIVASVALIGVAALGFVHWREKPPPTELARFQVFPPDKSSFAGSDTLVSPDGRHVAFDLPGPDGRTQLWVRSLDSLELRALAGTDGASNGSFWSPDSRFLGFAVQGKLKKVDTSGGPAQTICDIPGRYRGGAWSRDGVIIFGTNATGLWRVSDAGGIPSPVTKLDASRKEAFHVAPSFLPDGRHFLYHSRAAGEDDTGVYLASLDAKPEQQSSKRLLVGSSAAIYAPASGPGSSAGRVLFTRGGSLMAQAFDLRRLELAGEAVTVAKGMADGGPPAFSASTTDVLAYRTGAGGGLVGAITLVTWLDRKGTALGNAVEAGAYDTLALSPDGSRVALSRVDRQLAKGLSLAPYDIWVHEFQRTSTRLTSDSARDWFPTWSPDGSRIIFSSERGGAVFNLYQKASNSAGDEEVLFKSSDDKSAQDWSRDGRFLLYSVSVRGNPISQEATHDLWVLPLNPDNPGDRKPIPYLKTEFNESQAQFSPDSHFIAYRSDASGRDEIYVQPFPAASGGKWTVSRGGGIAPRWRADGKELFYISADSKMMAVEVSTNPVFKAGAPKALFEAPIWGGGRTNNVTRYDVTADGKKFLIITAPSEGGAPAATPITVVMNWTTLLKK